MAKDLYRADRLVMFSDAVVAIAITLLVLPLTDMASNLASINGTQFMDSFFPKVMLFLISFAVVARFWWVHYNIFNTISFFNARLVILNFIWLVSIVIIPFTTELITASGVANELGARLYIGTLFLTAFVGLLMQFEMVRTPALYEDKQPEGSLAGGVAVSILIGAALIVTIIFPSTGLYPLLFAFLSGPLTILLKKKYKKTTP